MMGLLCSKLRTDKYAALKFEFLLCMCAYERFPTNDVAEQAHGSTICPTVTPASTAATCTSMRARVCIFVCGALVSERHLTMCASLPPPPSPNYNV